MKNTNKTNALVCIILAICGRTILCAQVPAISISADSSGSSRAYLASSFTVPHGFTGLFSDIDNEIFTTKLVQPFKEGDVIATMNSGDRGWSYTKVPLNVGTNNVQYPIFATITQNGNTLVPLPAILKFKIDIKAGTVLTSGNDTNKSQYVIETKRAIKAGDSISIIYYNGPKLLSVEAADGAKTDSETKPWFTAYLVQEKPEGKQAAIEAWKIERSYVGQ